MRSRRGQPRRAQGRRCESMGFPVMRGTAACHAGNSSGRRSEWDALRSQVTEQDSAIVRKTLRHDRKMGHPFQHQAVTGAGSDLLAERRLQCRAPLGGCALQSILAASRHDRRDGLLALGFRHRQTCSEHGLPPADLRGQFFHEDFHDFRRRKGRRRLRSCAGPQEQDRRQEATQSRAKGPATTPYDSRLHFNWNSSSSSPEPRSCSMLIVASGGTEIRSPAT